MIMTTQQKFNTISAAIEEIIKDHPEYEEEHTTGWDLVQGLYYIQRGFLLEMYPNQDGIWPSRRWNEDYNDYVDLSGHIVIDKEEYMVSRAEGQGD